MNIIVFTRAHRKPLRLTTDDRQVRFAVAGIALAALMLIGGSGYWLGATLGGPQRHARSDLSEAKALLIEQRAQLAELREDNATDLNALALHLGQLQARSSRLEALGQRLTTLGQLDDGEFDFSQPPAMGGPEEPLEIDSLGRIDLDRELLAFEQRLTQQESQLGVLETLINNRELEEGLQPAGSPVRSGWLSSRYGNRADPFTAKPAMHHGIDFSGAPNAEIVAVAGGVVTWSGARATYGNMVDIDHGNGYVTRYAHNKENKVQVGDRVRAGDTIALMGSTGRATSNHVHFEVWFEGRRIDPTQLISSIR